MMSIANFLNLVGEEMTNDMHEEDDSEAEEDALIAKHSELAKISCESDDNEDSNDEIVIASSS
jgi:hypothetical protein